MANIPRSAKSGDEWNQNDLHSYDIKIEFQDAQTFFSETSLPEPSVQQDFLTARSCDDTIDDVSFNLFAQLECAIPYGQGWDNGTVDFVVALFHAMGYMHRPHVIHSGMKLPFDICSKEEIIHTDVCISRTDTKQIILLVQVAEPDMDPHARLIAAAIAAFQDNNDTGPPMWSPLDNRVIFGIILCASCPSFFKIPVTRVLSECVQYGQFPPTPTIVAGFVPDIHSNSDRFLLGMGNLDQRRIFLQCFEAFKKFLM
ncbi:hypothetical protein BDN70DRAFT_575005 [Pholiota conissans]|uniref:Uncharacterized protein n=1 Tax=Pholiota conissans TaxID=109636 RepID=A0A9P6CVR7_9AGAR|nr:hypothetical protein BDN70DRAFT_575005 [Pholiota conissans]